MIAKALIVKDGRYLLGKRKDRIGPEKISYWDLPGGHVEEGEGYLDALSRELWEELGVEFSIGELAHKGAIVLPDWYEEYRAYWVEASGEFTLTEHERVEWVHPSEFDNYTIYPHWREALRAVTGV